MSFKPTKVTLIILSVIAIGAISGFISTYTRSFTLTPQETEIADNLSEEILSDDQACSFERIFYKIGTIDAEFGIPKEDFSEIIKEAEAIWENTAGSDIFSTDNSIKSMAINLVFDERQARTLELKERMEGISSTEEKYNALKEEHSKLLESLSIMSGEIESSKSRYDLTEEVYLLESFRYEERVAIYEKDVAYWNSSGGAPANEYNRLITEKAELDTLREQMIESEKHLALLIEEINKKVAIYNELAHQVNTIAGMLNRLAESLSMSVASYNRIAVTGEEFAAGTYKTNGIQRSIDIYQFYDRTELTLIIAHEMGHALGLSHGVIEDSIMYPKIKAQTKKLSEEDVSLLTGVCK